MRLRIFTSLLCKRSDNVPKKEINSLAVILPIYNERGIIGEMIDSVEAFAAENPHYYFLFVDDGSDDGTAEILKAAVDKQSQANIAFFHCEKNLGKGYAVKIGFEMAEADALCFIDSDMAYSLDHLKLIEEKLQTNDVVIGSRKLTTSWKKRSSLRRQIMGECFNCLVRRMLDLPFRDTQAGVKGFRFKAARRIFEKLAVMGFAFDVELLFLANKFGFGIAEIAAQENEKHRYKKGKLKLIKDSLIMFSHLLLIRLRNFTGSYD